MANLPGPTTPIRPNPNRSTEPYKFTEDELRVLKECNRDSFFQRCLPMGTLMGTAAYYGVKSGYLKPSPRYGATPKVVVSVILGYFIGKISYQTKCAERLMQIPDSKLGEILRRRKMGGAGGPSFQESLDSIMPFSTTNPSDVYSDIGPMHSDIDTTRPDQPGLEDHLRPSLDNPIFDEETPMPVPQNEKTTYDELRKKNRDIYSSQRTGNYTPNQAENMPVVRRPAEELNAPKITNKYGDVME